MKMIVTGGEGFIGKALTTALKKRGVEVMSIDRRSGIEVADFFSSDDLSDIDCVYHLAAQTSVFNTSLNAWTKAIKSLPRKDMAIDPAYLSASTNEWQNVFYNYRIKLEIEVPPNTPFYLTDNFMESEVVFGRSSKLQFLKADLQSCTHPWGSTQDYVVIRLRMIP